MSPLAHFAKVLEEFPSFFFGFIFSLLAVICSDPIILALTLGCIALGFVIGPVWAVIAFLLVYVQIRTFNSIANAIGNGLVAVASSLVPPPTPLDDLPPPPMVTPQDTTLPDS